MDADNLVLAFVLTSIAGLTTGLGGAIILFVKQLNIKFLSAALGLSAGVMIFISFVEIFTEANHSLALLHGDQLGYVYTLIAFFAGMLLIAIIDALIPLSNNPHELHYAASDLTSMPQDPHGLMRIGLVSGIAIAIHNFPEGVATFVSAAKDIEPGIGIAVAVAIHNIPEGIAIAVPIFYASGNKQKAVGYATLSGLAEPLGGVLGFFLLTFLLGDGVLGIILAAVAGIMVYISFDQLLPTAEKYGHHHLAMIGVVSGMLVMGITLIF